MAVGGIQVAEDAVVPLERGLERLCCETGFPPGEEFKWSPRRTGWMWGHLHAERRWEFYRKALTVGGLYGVRVTVVVADVACRPAIGRSTSADHDVTTMFLERADNALRAAGTSGIVVIDRPGGNRVNEAQLLAACFDTVTTGTAYVLPKRIVGVEPAAGDHVRLLQFADLVTGCTLARVAGSPWARAPFELIRPLLRTDGHRIGGVGLKLHPDFKYANLYHWLLGDNTWWKGSSGWGLPCRGPLYYEGPGELR